jgi:glycosyltransferase involved in cell wall biosynthesis
MARSKIDIVLPAHNEGTSIAATLREFHEVATKATGAEIRFVVSEDGSKDDTVEQLKRVSAEVPLLLISAPGRKGYSRAVIDGLRAATSDVVGFIDSDGQCDPKSFADLLAELPQADLVLGYRNPRRDPWVRLVASFFFHLVYRTLFPVRVKDPSCPYFLVRRQTLLAILDGNVGVLKQGFWWEFVARAQSLGARITEVPVSHRPRSKGESRVYTGLALFREGLAHIKSLFVLRRELRGLPPAQPSAEPVKKRRAK